MVTGAYAGNAASRHQLRGRLRRLGQQRKVSWNSWLVDVVGVFFFPFLGMLLAQPTTRNYHNLERFQAFKDSTSSKIRLIWIERFSKKAGCRIKGLNEGPIPVVGGCEKQWILQIHLLAITRTRRKRNFWVESYFSKNDIMGI